MTSTDTIKQGRRHIRLLPLRRLPPNGALFQLRVAIVQDLGEEAVGAHEARQILAERMPTSA